MSAASIREKVVESVKVSMKAREEQRVGILRLINAAIKEKDINSEMKGQKALSETEILGLLQTMIKQRKESASIFQSAGRNDLYDKEVFEIAVIEEFLPKQMDDAETKAAIQKILQELNVTSMKDMGKVMPVLKERYAGQLDMGKASGFLKELLQG